ncbi:MAG: nucleotidyltransferase domain-containing protein [candidate division KSB1 bacterium]|nr:nucleotidyltransferase domain-containing protein [candidate division KSB1 bacterium]
MLTKNTLKNKITSHLQSNENIIFAVTFGSFNSPTFGELSDIDIGIFCRKKLELLEWGGLISQLQSLTQRRVDLVQLNDLYNKNPLFSYQIITRSELLFSTDEGVWIDFKTKTFTSYFDTHRLREMINSIFYKRISEKKFGQRNYA